MLHCTDWMWSRVSSWLKQEQLAVFHIEYIDIISLSGVILAVFANALAFYVKPSDIVQVQFIACCTYP